MLHVQSLESKHRLTEVIGEMICAAEQDGEAITRRIFRELFFRHGRVTLEPVGLRHFFEPLRQFSVYGNPCSANLFVRRSDGLRRFLLLSKTAIFSRRHSAPIRGDLIEPSQSAIISIRWGTRHDPPNPFQNKPALSCTLARATSTVFRASLNSLIFPFSATSREKKS